MRKVIHLSLMIFFALAILAGCATQSTTETVRRETVQYPAERAQDEPEPVMVEKRTTEKTETTRTEGESGGLLSGTVRVVGQTLALPFRAVGGLIGLMF